jgi:hypothetical protein
VPTNPVIGKNIIAAMNTHPSTSDIISKVYIVKPVAKQTPIQNPPNVRIKAMMQGKITPIHKIRRKNLKMILQTSPIQSHCP